MNAFKHTVRLLGVGLAVAVIATGCASAKKGGEMATPAAAAAAPAAAPPPAAAPAMAGDKYVVGRGDCLWCISEKADIYGDPYKWPLIFKGNKDQIRDADLIYPGQELSIERNASAGDIELAVQHAKTRGAWSLGPVEETDTAYLTAAGK